MTVPSPVIACRTVVRTDVIVDCLLLVRTRIVGKVVDCINPFLQGKPAEGVVRKRLGGFWKEMGMTSIERRCLPTKGLPEELSRRQERDERLMGQRRLLESIRDGAKIAQEEEESG